VSRERRQFIYGAEWNGGMASAEICDVVVPEWQESDEPHAWWKPLSGQTVMAVLVRYYDQRHLLFDGDGSATNKVTHGGGPNMPSKSLPMRAWRSVP
jgi:hypothetical protein